MDSFRVLAFSDADCTTFSWDGVNHAKVNEILNDFRKSKKAFQVKMLKIVHEL
jgi:hypothetical protein